MDLDDKITVFISSVSSNRELKKRQERILTILEGKRIPFEKVDIAVNEDDKHRMRDLCGEPTALPPQVFKGEKYLGDYDAFDEAVETDGLKDFLQPA